MSAIDEILGRRPWLNDFDLDAFGFSESRGQDVDEEIGNRLIRAYQSASARRGALTRGTDVWSSFVYRHYGPMLDLVRAGNAGALLNYLRSLPMQGAGHGYFQGRQAYDRLLSDSDSRRERAIWFCDHLVSYAEFEGLLRVRCPEQGEWEHPPVDSLQHLLTSLRGVDMPLAMPPVFDGLFGARVDGQTYHLRTLMASYLVRQLQQMGGIRKVAEIGAGIGFTAFVAASVGIDRYVLYDLPEVNLAQGYFLMHALGPGQVRLSGETNAAPVAVLSTDELLELDSADVVVNIDSLPEIDQSISAELIGQIAARSGRFISVNQEAPHTDADLAGRLPVRELVARHSNMRLQRRHRNWIRSGYVDEFFVSEDRV